MLTFLALFCFVVAALGLAWNLKASYDSEGGGLGQTPVLGVAVIQLPLLTLLGLSLLGRENPFFEIANWMYPLLWLGSAAIFGGCTILAGHAGKYAKKARRSDH